MSISVNDLSKAIVEELKTYTTEVREGIDDAADDVATMGVKELKQTSPKRYGRYRRSWGKTEQKDGVVVHNKKHYQLTHLLEKGHAKVNGGRVKAIPHIAPVEESMIKEFEKKAEDVIKG